MGDAPLAPLFRRHERLRAVIDTVLEGRGGRIRRAPSSEAALLDFGCYHIPGGDPDGASDLLHGLAGPCEIVFFADDDPWRRAVRTLFGPRARDRSNQSFVPGPSLVERTRELSAAVPRGYELRRLDVTLATDLDPALSPNGVEVSGGPTGFVERGFGWALLHGRTVICAATSYGVSSRFAEVAITTHPDHRGRGLAACAASAMLQESLRRGLEPHWNAFNPISQRLAERLGFTPVGLAVIDALDYPKG